VALVYDHHLRAKIGDAPRQAAPAARGIACAVSCVRSVWLSSTTTTCVPK
jgi:hypothetical protein